MDNFSPGKLRHTFRISILEGVFVQIYSGLALGVFVTKFALMLNASPFQLGLLSSIGQFASVFQLFGIVVTNRVASIKTTIIRISYAARTMPFFWGIIPFIASERYAVTLLLIFSFIGTSLNTLVGNMWVEWIASTVPQRIRGRFFSIRQQYLIVAGVVVGFVFSIIIDAFHSETVFVDIVNRFVDARSFFSPDNLPYVFLFVFVLGTAAGLTSLSLLRYQPDTAKREIKPVQFTYFLDSFKDKNFRALIIFSCWWMAAIGIGSPFWGPYMIDKLKMSLFQIQLYGLVSSISSLVFLRFWGKVIDKYGNKQIMVFLIVLGSINPLVWFFTSEQSYWIIYVEALTSGLMWSGAGIISMNFAISVAPKELRQLYAGFYGAVGSLAMTVTMLLSGKFYPEAAVVWGRFLHPEQILFLITGFARLTAIIPLLFVKETTAKALSYNISQFSQFSKVRILKFGQWFYERFKISS